ncbi:hypothetical protein Poras_1099 [Porphyromonas asaccharolytica DSM 20707]|uniref:Uncharacterized protein n=1 Tax=Porphyromonas asaccharolytica (strain ATCC 25260 / DSM 20707 / BCRC 10618 / CCUG 7834 / JCM 6326 / LMG 13178 / VPI 4198 / B440) TaxID=879243 RepID=F4KL29_PORAD|nr:hypothetical protein Poras_1099 [Porphyromonas asaccharolytica DSM 20707]
MKKVVFVLLLVIAGQWLSAQEGAATLSLERPVL